MAAINQPIKEMCRMQDRLYRVSELGNLIGDVTLFGGAYSKLQASQAMLEQARTLNIPVPNRLCSGAIGMLPHDGYPDTRYILLSSGGIQIKRLSYNAASAKAAMQQSGLVQGYEISLMSGCWPSEDILPASMRR